MAVAPAAIMLAATADQDTDTYLWGRRVALQDAMSLNDTHVDPTTWETPPVVSIVDDATASLAKGCLHPMPEAESSQCATPWSVISTLGSPICSNSMARPSNPMQITSSIMDVVPVATRLCSRSRPPTSEEARISNHWASEADWVKQRKEITQLYDSHPLWEVMKIMEVRYHLVAT